MSSGLHYCPVQLLEHKSRDELIEIINITGLTKYHMGRLQQEQDMIGWRNSLPSQIEIDYEVFNTMN